MCPTASTGLPCARPELPFPAAERGRPRPERPEGRPGRGWFLLVVLVLLSGQSLTRVLTTEEASQPEEAYTALIVV
jgi:hypothetical protein